MKITRLLGIIGVGLCLAWSSHHASMAQQQVPDSTGAGSVGTVVPKLRNSSGKAVFPDDPTALPLPVAGSFSATPPYSFSPSSTSSSDQHNLAVTTATSLTVPSDAVCANVSTKGGAVNWRWDGTAPTASVGNGMAQGATAQFCGRNILLAIQFIQQTGNTSTLDVAYSK
jgi:hypothetical protein